MIRLAGCVILLVSSAFADQVNRLQQQFTTDEVVPNVISVVPQHVLHVQYSANVYVNLGEERTPTQVKDAPVNISWPVEPEALYTLLMIDPDAPIRTNPFVGEVLHWMVINISGSNLVSGTTISPYLGSGPPEGSGLHRYIFLVFKQPRILALDKTDQKRKEIRYKFNSKSFVRKYNLGKPVAGNYFNAQFDELIRQKYALRVGAEMKKNLVIPDIINSPPADAAMFKYANDTMVLFGFEITPTQAKNAPVEMNWPTEVRENVESVSYFVFNNPSNPAVQCIVHVDFGGSRCS